MKPPANVSGLVYFIKDVSTCFSVEEQSSIAKSAPGNKLKQSFDRCVGHSKQLNDARAQLKRKLREMSGTTPTNTTILEANTDDSWKEEINTMKRKIQVEEMKYIDCLTYMTCPDQWKQYTKCWDNSMRALTPDELQDYKNDGTINLICRSERVSIERCVGSLVSNAIMAGDVSPP
jgi:hypothetical protein